MIPNKLFLLSGLGADERLFKNLDLSGYEVVPINWITPDSDASLKSYATELIELFGIAEGSSVIGISLGGMISIEIAKQVKLKHVIVISTIKSKAEMPWYFSVFRTFSMYKIMSGGLLQKLGPVVRPIFGVFAGKKDADLFVTMLKDNDPKFLTWAMGAVLHWNGEPAPYKVHHLIGDADLVFHIARIRDAIVIPKGDHMMVFTRAKEISPIIRNILAQ